MHLPDIENQTCEFISHFLAKLGEDKIKYCILKNYDSLPEKVGNDIDMWVEDGGQEQFQRRLLETGRCLGWDLIEYSPRLKYDYFFVKNNDGQPEIIHIDCWSSVNWRGINYLDDRAFSETLLLHKKGFYIPSPGLESSILLLKDLIYQKKILEKYRKRIFCLFNKEPEVFSKYIEASFTKRAAKFVLEKVKNKKWQELEGQTNFLRWALFRKVLFKRHLFYLRDTVMFIWGRMKKYFFPKTGVLLVLLGPDGSGKSTIAEHILRSEIIRKLFMKKMYFHRQFDFLPPLRKYFSLFTKSKANHPPAPLQTKTFGMFRAMVYPLYYGISYFLGHPLVWKQKACAGLMIFDRYFYDYLMQRELMKCPKWLIFWIAKLIPKPDILIYLRTQPEIIYDRKQELTMDEIQRQNEVCEKFTADFPGGFSIEASCTVEKIINQIEWLIVEKIKEKQKL